MGLDNQSFFQKFLSNLGREVNKSILKVGANFPAIGRVLGSNRVARALLERFYSHENLTQTYTNAIITSERFYGNPSTIQLQPGQQIFFRTTVLGPDNRFYMLEGALRTNEVFSQNRFRQVLASKLPADKFGAEGRSSYIRAAELNSNFYIRTVTPR